MRLSRTAVRTIAPALVLALASLTACGDEDSSSDDEASSSASTTESESGQEEPSGASTDSSEGDDEETEDGSDGGAGASEPADRALCKKITAKVISEVFDAKAGLTESRTGCGFMMLSVGATVTVAEGEPPAGQDLEAGFARAKKNAPGKAEDLPDFGEEAFISVEEGPESTLATSMMRYGDGIAVFSASDPRPGIKEKVIELMDLAKEQS